MKKLKNWLREKLRSWLEVDQHRVIEHKIVHTHAEVIKLQSESVFNLRYLEKIREFHGISSEKAMELMLDEMRGEIWSMIRQGGLIEMQRADMIGDPFEMKTKVRLVLNVVKPK